MSDSEEDRFLDETKEESSVGDAEEDGFVDKVLKLKESSKKELGTGDKETTKEPMDILIETGSSVNADIIQDTILPTSYKREVDSENKIHAEEETPP